jgi:hypothetical protein
MYNWFWTYKVFDKNSYDILILGDSRVYRGISPVAIEKVLHGFKAKNLGFSSAGFSAPMFDLANKYLDKKRNNKIIIMGITPSSLTRYAAKNEHIQNIKQKNKTEVFMDLYLTPVLSFFDPIIPIDIIGHIFGHYYKTYYSHEGWAMSWKKPEKQNSALRGYRTQFSKNKVSLSVIDSLYLQVKYWADTNILVFGFRFPASNELMAVEDSLSGFDEIKLKTGFIQKGGIWLNFEKGKYHTYDGSHLRTEAAIRFSNDLALEIKSYLETKK